MYRDIIFGAISCQELARPFSRCLCLSLYYLCCVHLGPLRDGAGDQYAGGAFRLCQADCEKPLNSKMMKGHAGEEAGAALSPRHGRRVLSLPVCR